MSARIDLTNKRFERLLVLDLAGRVKDGHASWRCRCDCGKETVVSSTSLRSKNTLSCGCLGRQRAKARIIHGHNRTGKRTSEYMAWVNMIDRCYSNKNKQYHDYGGRGIVVCDRWLNSFENFLQDMGLKTSPKHSINRVDNDGNYEPRNCKWNTKHEQDRNKRSTHFITYNGVTKCLQDWADFFKINHTTILHRFKSGWSIERALTTRSQRYGR